MIIRKSISLQSHVLKVAERKAKLMHGGKLSYYINFLICRDSPEEVREELIQEVKPTKVFGIFKDEHKGACVYCHEEIVGEECCRVVLDNGAKGWAHKRCYKKES